MGNNISSEPLISSYTFRYYSDQGWMSSGDNNQFISKLKNGIEPENVKDGDRIYVVTEYLHKFFNEIAPKIKSNYILISSRCDQGVDGILAKRIPTNCIHWYTHNNTCTHPRISTIPLGIQNLHWLKKDNPQSDVNLIMNVKDENISVDKDVLLTFQKHTNITERQKCWNYFADKSWVTTRKFNQEQRMDKEFVREYFREIKRHKFTVCPFGNGYDCHRNWEVWSLGSVPIIRKHKSMEEFYDMPAWFVDNWEEVTEANIDKQYNYIIDNYDSFNHKKQKFEYWKEKIFSINKITK
jgi:hypothetical protein